MRHNMTLETADAETATCPRPPSWPFILDLACDSPSRDYRMADIPILPIGHYEVCAVGGGIFQAWSNVKDDTQRPKNWFNTYHMVTVGNGSIGIQQFGSGVAYAGPAEALSYAKPHRFEVRNEQLVIFCIRDSGQDNRGGIRLQISRIS
jgi:hypothetical protein